MATIQIKTKPKFAEAVKYDGTNFAEVNTFCNEQAGQNFDEVNSITIPHVSGQMMLYVDEYAVKDWDGHYSSYTQVLLDSEYDLV